MKKYTTSEVIGSLMANPKLKFKSQVGNVIGINDCGDCVWVELHGEKSNITVDLNSYFLAHGWEPIQEPVPFMEAVKAYEDGKTIRCERDRWVFVYIPTESNKVIGNQHGYLFISRDGSRMTSKDITEGKWYIEG